MDAAKSSPPGSSFWHLPVDAARHGPAFDAHLLLNLWVALTLIVLAHLLLFAGTVVRRRSPRSGRTVLLEYLPLAALAVIFTWLGARAQQLWAAQRYVGADPEAMQVEVTGVQFVWYFRYPGADATFGATRLALAAPGEGNPLGLDPGDPHGADDIVSSQLVLPAGREVDLTLHAQDVIHGFAVPEMRLKQNAVPGATAHIHFTPERLGSYTILCTQLCGLGHYRMQATLQVLPPARFQAWLQARAATRASSLAAPASPAVLASAFPAALASEFPDRRPAAADTTAVQP